MRPVLKRGSIQLLNLKKQILSKLEKFVIMCTSLLQKLNY